jgi:two-component system, NarL family, response regulator YdfI
MANRNGGGAVRVLLASASAVRRAGLETLVKSAPSLRLVGSLQGTHSIAQRAAELELRPDVVLADYGSESAPALISPLNLPTVALIDQPGFSWTAHALRSGVKAILPRESRSEDIVAAIQSAHAGWVLLDPKTASSLLDRVPKASPHLTQHDDLTPREIEVLAMMTEGLSNRQIAYRLCVSGHTIKFHISSILDKLGASTRTEAVTLGLRMGLILL